MRLPQHLLNNVCFVVETADELCKALGESAEQGELDEIKRLVDLGLPPVTSISALSVMTGFNSGFLWSLANKTSRYYRIFEIPKGRSRRQIEAPKVGLKIIQKWLSYHFSNVCKVRDFVHGFVPRRSHLTAAATHLEAKWVLSLDLENFFPSTNAECIRTALLKLGYRPGPGFNILMGLLLFQGRLSQGAPSSPVLSNVAFSGIDEGLAALARHHSIRLTRYADDVTFSGVSEMTAVDEIEKEVEALLSSTPWKISRKKRSFSKAPNRLKVHGVLVSGTSIRLTKGYRNRIRAYRHLMNHERIQDTDLPRVKGHLIYADQVSRFSGERANETEWV